MLKGVYIKKIKENFCARKSKKISIVIKNVIWSEKTLMHKQGSYASGKCQGNLKFFKVRELSGNFIICQGKLNFF